MKWHNIHTTKPASLAYILVTNGQSIGITRYRDIRSSIDEQCCKRLSMYDDEGATPIFPSCITHWTYVTTAIGQLDDGLPKLIESTD